MKAFLANYRQSPRKVRLVATLIKGKTVAVALSELDFIPRRSSLPIKKLISSAVANASHNFNVSSAELYIKDLRVDKGLTIKRFMPASRGRAHGIKKRSSHISLTLAPLADRPTKKKVSAKKKVGTVTTTPVKTKAIKVPKTTKSKATKE